MRDRINPLGKCPAASAALPVLSIPAPPSLLTCRRGCRHPFDGRVVSNFIRQALANENITIYGTGEASSAILSRHFFERCLHFRDGDDVTMIRRIKNTCPIRSNITTQGHKRARFNSLAT